jgi:branched-chain amino acid transport system ATP-binding protein
MTDLVLSTRGINVKFGGLVAVESVSIDIPHGKIVGLIGPNGAGKTTFVDAVCGFVPADGTVEVAGRDVSSLKPHGRCRAGLGRTWQASELFNDLSVAENLAISASRLSVRSVLRDLVRRQAPFGPDVHRVLSLLGIENLADSTPSELSEGQRKLVGIARAFAGRPVVVCLDEPAAGLDTHESTALAQQLRHLGADGTSLLLIDHDMSFVFGLCDHVIVMEYGRVIAEGRPDEVRNDPQVIAAYLGTTVQDRASTQNELS